MKEFKINDFLSLKLEEGKTNIYVKGRLFNQCKFLLLEIPVEEIQSFDEIESIDAAAEKLDKSLEGQEPYSYKIPPETEFWGHCSNLQVWYENDYDTRLLHRNLAFPLLKELTDRGDPLAKRAFKEEIAKRIESGHTNVVKYLFNENYLDCLNNEELLPIITSILNALDELPYDDKYAAFLRLISAIKGTKLMEDNFSNLLNVLEKLPDNRKYYAFSVLTGAIKGTELMDKHYSLIETKFTDLLNVIDKLPDYDKYRAFSELFYAIKGTKLMDKHYSLIETKFTDLLNVLEKLPDDDKYYAFSVLTGAIKGTELMSEKFLRKFDKELHRKKRNIY